ncbi:MAG: arsenosugar biosynthesis radical SAM protein ArsS [Magnetococcales bacterium]|nr:arsenosugar biosynthesis radical SAM protein ArsS [Magnetococcales bacterium]
MDRVCGVREKAVLNDFLQTVEKYSGEAALPGCGVSTIQVNVGLRCNLECRHCHVAASPRRREAMSWATMERVLALAEKLDCREVDITGGAPELNPHFKKLITALTERHIRVQVRTNLTVLLEPELGGMAEFLRDQGVGLVASLPCYLEENVEAQRGEGSYQQSVAAIRLLNTLGYGVDPSLPLNLVYNPGGPSLPPSQATLEADYRREMQDRFGLSFTRLLTIANMPIGRFLAQLRKRREEADYWALLEQAFNPDTLDGLMCRRQISIAWDGGLYDCDFNLALGLPMALDKGGELASTDPKELRHRQIITGNHCFACTAGSGSSCAGALAA